MKELDFGVRSNGNGTTEFFGFDGSGDDVSFMLSIEEDLCFTASSVAMKLSKSYRFPPPPGTKPIKIRLEIEYED